MRQTRWPTAPGCPTSTRDLTLEDVEAWDPVIRAIEIQRPHWRTRPTGTRTTPSTIGWLAGRGHPPHHRAHCRDATSAGRWAIRSGSHTWIGLPASERDQVAWMEPPLPDEDSELARGFAAARRERHLVRAMSLGKALRLPGRRRHGDVQ